MINVSLQREVQGQRSILVVDDMEANRAVLCRRLERFGYSVTSVDSGPAALAFLEEATPDVVLLDYMMPHMNGIEVLQELRHNPRTRELPVIMVTARAESEATIEALGAGADDYVTKPIDFDVLRARIESHVGKISSAADLKRANAALDERVTLRNMALADLEAELSKEIEKRRELERRLAACTENVAIAPDEARMSGHLATQLEALAAKFEIVFNSATSGRMPNFAQMAELKLLIGQVQQSARATQQSNQS